MTTHGSSETNAVHYGKKRFGYSGAIAVSPIPEEVLTVKNASDFLLRNEHLAK